MLYKIGETEKLKGDTYCEDGVRWLRPEKVIEIHHRMISLTPGEIPGVRDQGRLDSACKRPYFTLFYEQNKDIFMLAAVLGEAICKGHPFHNANKRTAAASSFVFLLYNGYKFEGEKESVITAYEGVARETISKGQLTEWLSEWSVPLDASFPG